LGEAHAAGLFCAKKAFAKKPAWDPIFHKKLLAHRTGYCIVSSPMPLFFYKTGRLQKKAGMGPAHAIAHFLQTKRCKKARHGALFLTATTNGIAS
jgi:hypothetical protein